MGATTLYHPIPLHVIRGAAEYCGFQFGVISQGNSDAQHGTASYTAEIVKMPRGAEDWSVKAIQRQLNHCFMDDLQIWAVWINSKGKWSCGIKVALSVTATLDEIAEDLAAEHEILA